MTPGAGLRRSVRSMLAHSGARGLALVLVAAAIGGAAIHSYRSIDAELTASALASKQTFARLSAVTLAGKFERLVDVAVSLATRVRMRELVAAGRWAEAAAILRDVPQDLPHVERLFLADADGTLRADTPPLPGVRGVSFAHREWYRGVSRHWRPYISSIYTRLAEPRIDVLAVAAPVRDATGSVAGVLVMQVRVDTLTAWFDPEGAGPRAAVHAVDPEGRRGFFAAAAQAADVTDVMAGPIVDKLLGGQEGVEIVGTEPARGRIIAAYAPVRGFGWSVVVTQPVDASLELATRDKLLSGMVVVYGLMLLLASLTVVLVSHIAVDRQRSENERRMHAERERAAAALRARDALLTEMGAMAHIGGWEFDARTLKGSWTEEVARIHELDPGAEIDAARGMEFYTAESRARIEAAVREALEHGTPYDLELELVTAKGNRKWVRTIGRPVTDNGSVIKVRGSFQDITERRVAEEEVRRLNRELERKVRERTAELESANKELEAFSYSVSHDLRAPLRAVDGFSQVLLEDYSGVVDEEGRHCLERVRAGTQRMGALIDDLLQLSRLTRTEMRREPVDLSALAEAVFAELRRGDPQSRFEPVVAPGLRAVGDPVLIQAVLSNLLANAIKFSSREPSPRVELGARDERGETVFYVRDNGVGFDMSYAGKLFGAFQRLHSESEFDGTGVGLATVQRVIRRHGGRVWAESAVGEGATFHFTLPGSTAA